MNNEIKSERQIFLLVYLLLLFEKLHLTLVDKTVLVLKGYKRFQYMNFIIQIVFFVLQLNKEWLFLRLKFNCTLIWVSPTRKCF